MRKVPCPICGKTLFTVSDDIFIDYDLRKATQKEFCNNCKRKIRYSEKKRTAIFEN
jgi:C4-type Zn-finger protein